MANQYQTIILYNSVPYFIDHISKKGYWISEMYRNEGLLNRIGRKICQKLSLNDSFLYGDWVKKITTAKYIIVFAPIESKILEFIKKRNPSIKIIYWYWNPAYRIGRPTDKLRKLADIWTFDKIDKVNYNLKYNNTFYFNSIQKLEVPIVYDLVFVGRNKHRKEKLLELKNYFESKDFKSIFHIVPNRNEKNPEKIKELSYAEYLKLISSSKAILDIMPPSQVGLTLRPMESLFLEIKIITDNEHIKEEPFYNPQNIFILGQDSLDNLRIFLDSPFVPISEEIKNNYDFDNWCKRIINETKI